MTNVRRILHSGVFSLTAIAGASLLAVFFLLPGPAILLASSKPLLVFAGAAGKPPTEQAARLFKETKGVDVQVTFGGSGFVLSQMKLARKGDIYFPGSSDFMEKAKKEKLVYPGTEKIITYLIPAINVQKGNPRNIRSLRDLLKPGVRLGIADPETVCVGTYAVEVVEKNLSPEERERFRRNLVTTAESCEKTATSFPSRRWMRSLAGGSSSTGTPEGSRRFFSARKKSPGSATSRPPFPSSPTTGPWPVISFNSWFPPRGRIFSGNRVI
jgi:ABC-type molybdate transport system substrate-binding protein